MRFEKVGKYSRAFDYDNRGLITLLEESGIDTSKVERTYDSSGRISTETISLNGQPIQQTIQTWAPAHRIL